MYIFSEKSKCRDFALELAKSLCYNTNEPAVACFWHTGKAQTENFSGLYTDKSGARQVQGFLLDLWKRGERMSLEAITKIRAVEDGAEQSKADARAQAQKLAADAEREGRALLNQGREKAAGVSAKAMQEAEGKAARRRDEILAQAAKDCEKLKADAGARMDKAVQAILGRVVEG